MMNISPKHQGGHRRRIALTTIAAALTVCCGALVGGCQQSATTLGQFSELPRQEVVAVRHARQALNVSIHGTMVEKCPVAGCWFKLRDSTGIVKVDCKGAGFTVTNVPLQTEMTVSGKVADDGSEKLLDASGLRY
jgi:uncharacterized protein YdeI (BOF family)